MRRMDVPKLLDYVRTESPVKLSYKLSKHVRLYSTLETVSRHGDENLGKPFHLEDDSITRRAEL